MPTKRKGQPGFNIVEIVLIVIVVGLLATVGWLVYQNNRTKISDAAGSGNQSNSQSSQSQKPTVTYLNVKEWGVKLPLSDGIKDAYYAVPTGISLNADGLPSGIIVGVRSLDAVCGFVSAKSTDFNNAFAEIVRALPNEKDPVSGKSYMELLPNGITINGYYYGYSRMTDSKTCAPRDKLDSIDSGVMQATKSLAHS